MKRFLISTLVILLSLNMFAQSEHLTFKGVPIDGTLDQYVENMRKAGFTFMGKEDGIAILKGDFAGYRGCTIGVVTLKSIDIVNKIAVLFEEQDNWSKVYSVYSNLKEMLTTKYGTPAECLEKFEGYSQPDDDRDRMYELSMERCTYATVFKVPKGNIQLEIIKGQFGGGMVRLSYWDKINTSSVRQKALEDL